MAMLVMLFLVGTFGLNFPIFISTMAIGVFHADAQGFGLLSSCMAIGTVMGALWSAGRDQPRFSLRLGGAAVFGLGCTMAALAPGYWFFAAALVVIGMAALTLTNTSNSLMQLSTERAMRGRVMALRIGIALGGTPIGAVVGWVADNLGPRWALGVGAAAGFAAAGVALYALATRAHHRRVSGHESPSFRHGRRGVAYLRLVRVFAPLRTDCT
jgi:MFS family permease